ncbi:MAG: hypothetical protein QME96_18565, partial [Myxococcota bacterium]|nr:hypothetical protein [Myxococcota bacterium]
MSEGAEPLTLRGVLAAGPIGLGRALSIAIAVVDAAEEIRAAGQGRLEGIEPQDVILSGDDDVALRIPAAGAPRPNPDAAGAVRAVVRLLCKALGGDPDSADPAARFPPGFPPEARPLALRALDASSPAPLRTFGALREALLDLAHMDATPMRIDGSGRRAIASAIVRKVRFDAPGEAGRRHGAWCCVRLPDGGTGQVAFLVDPTRRDLAHHERTLSCMWPGCEVSAWGLPAPAEPPRDGAWIFDLDPDAILVVEPYRTFEATAIAAAHDVRCPAHYLVALRSGTGDVSAPLVAGRMADAALDTLLEHPSRTDAAVFAEARRARAADAAWLPDGGVERAEASLRAV